MCGYCLLDLYIGSEQLVMCGYRLLDLYFGSEQLAHTNTNHIGWWDLHPWITLGHTDSLTASWDKAFLGK